MDLEKQQPAVDCENVRDLKDARNWENIRDWLDKQKPYADAVVDWEKKGYLYKDYVAWAFDISFAGDLIVYELRNLEEAADLKKQIRAHVRREKVIADNAKRRGFQHGAELFSFCVVVLFIVYLLYWFKSI